MKNPSESYSKKLAAYEEICRNKGVPLTIQRRCVLAALVDRDDHPTADQIYEAVDRSMPGISRTTVYRVLDALVKAGVAQRVCHPGAAARFDARTERHHHVVCLHCEKVLDILDSDFDELPLPTDDQNGFDILDYSIHFRGICPDCRQRLNESPPTPKSK